MIVVGVDNGLLGLRAGSPPTQVWSHQGNGTQVAYSVGDDGTAYFSTDNDGLTAIAARRRHRCDLPAPRLRTAAHRRRRMALHGVRRSGARRPRSVASRAMDHELRRRRIRRPASFSTRRCSEKTATSTSPFGTAGTARTRFFRSPPLLRSASNSTTVNSRLLASRVSHSSWVAAHIRTRPKLTPSAERV